MPNTDTPATLHTTLINNKNERGYILVYTMFVNMIGCNANVKRRAVVSTVQVYASPSRRKMDTKGEGEEMTYPHICFMVDNFDEVSDSSIRLF